MRSPEILQGLGGAADGLEATRIPWASSGCSCWPREELHALWQGPSPVARATLLRGRWHPAPTTEAATRPHLHWLFILPFYFPLLPPPFPLQFCSLGSFPESLPHQPPAARSSERTWKMSSESECTHPHEQTKCGSRTAASTFSRFCRLNLSRALRVEPLFQIQMSNRLGTSVQGIYHSLLSYRNSQI